MPLCVVMSKGTWQRNATELATVITANIVVFRIGARDVAEITLMDM